MKLNAQTDFSLRLLIYLAAKDGGPATIQEISTRLGLSQSHMMRVAAKLAAKGFIDSSRGRQGGISLSKSAADITVEGVVRAMEPDFALVQCFDTTRGRCSIEPACLLQGVLSTALSAFFNELRQVNLAQLTQPNRSQLLQVLQLDPGEFRESIGASKWQ